LFLEGLFEFSKKGVSIVVCGLEFFLLMLMNEIRFTIIKMERETNAIL
jgi:hypothetical protein